MSEARKALHSRIRALLSKTATNGCTEHEALAALSKARELMDAYDVTDIDLELRGETASIYDAGPGDPLNIRFSFVRPVADFADCRGWVSYRTKPPTIKFCGLPSDTELAEWLLSHLTNYVGMSLTLYLLDPPEYSKTTARSFVDGCCSRITSRLRSLKQRPSGANALVVAKSHLIDLEMTNHGIKLSRSRALGPSRRDAAASAAGREAGDSAGFGRPLSRNPLRISAQ